MEASVESKPKTKLSELHRALCLAVASQMPKRSQNDPDAVKPLRDHLTMEYYGKIYDEMSEKELIGMIANINSGLLNGNKMPSAKQVSSLKFYMIAVALVYSNMDDWEYLDKSTGAILSGSDLRSLCVYQFYEGDKILPTNIVRRMYDEWINPKSNELLRQGKFVKFVRNPHSMYYETLTNDQVQYLIERYKQIYNNCINKTAKPVRARLN